MYPEINIKINKYKSFIDYDRTKFKKRLVEDGVLQTLKAKQFYEKPSEKRKREKAAGKARWLKKENKMKQDMGL